MGLCRAGHIPRRGWGGYAVVAHIAIAWDMRELYPVTSRVIRKKKWNSKSF